MKRVPGLGRLTRVRGITRRGVPFARVVRGGAGGTSTPAREWSWAQAYALPDLADWPEQAELLTRARGFAATSATVVMQSDFDAAGAMDAASLAALPAAIAATVDVDYSGLAIIDHETPSFSAWRSPTSTDAEVVAVAEYFAALLEVARQTRPLARWGMYAMPRPVGTQLSEAEWQRRVALSSALWAASDVVHLGCYVTTWEPEQSEHDAVTALVSTADALARPAYAWLCPRYARGSTVAANHGRLIPEVDLRARAQAIVAARSPWLRGIVVWDGMRNDSDEERTASIEQADVCWRAVVDALRGAQ